MSRSYDRFERLKLIESILPVAGTGKLVGLSGKQITEKLANSNPDLVLTKRTIERDLKELLSEERIHLCGKAGNSQIYARMDKADEIDGPVWEYFIEHMRSELEGIVSNTDLAKLLTRLKRPEPGIELDAKKVCILPDNLRLKPAAIDYKVFASVLKALKEGFAVQIKYKDRQDNVSEPVVHPLGIMQRGPRIYLVALKGENEGERHYALDRVIKAELLGPSDKQTDSFSFTDYIAKGKADFSDGEMIELKAVVSGYVEALLYDCPFNDSQSLVPLDGEQVGSYLSVTIPSSGQLLRWVLAGGANVFVLEPASLRDVLLGQVQEMYAQYQNF